MSIVEQFAEKVNKSRLFNRGDRLLIAVSGGVDSVVLCELCHLNGFSFEIAHCNFQLRGKESERDEEFVKDLAVRYNTLAHIKSFHTIEYSEQQGISIQEAARDLRYAWFKELVAAYKQGDGESKPARGTYLLTAHHADDNIETLLMRFLRGTGLKGLTGIPEMREFIRRPLLSFRKEELIEFATINNISFVEDSSNESEKYTRNLLRHTIIPELEKAYPEVRNNLTGNIQRLHFTNELYQHLVNELKAKLVRIKDGEVYLSYRKLLSYKNPTLFYEIVKDFGFSERQVPEIINLTSSQGGRFIDSGDGKFRMLKHRNWLIISTRVGRISSHIIINDAGTSLEFPGGVLSIRELKGHAQPLDGEKEVLLDAKEIRFPLVLRKWKAGDYFYPLGMRKKKKLSRFLIDRKIPITEKEKIWVIESESRIIWVVGHRIDDRFKSQEATSMWLHFQLK